MSNYVELGNGEDVTATWERGPNRETTKILDRALEIVNGVPYTVTLRWLFYGIWQEGYYEQVKATKTTKAKALAYKRFGSAFSKLRHSDHERWPIVLSDDRRDPVIMSDGYKSASDWLEALGASLSCDVDSMANQERYVIVAFEAEAMLSQFKYITKPYGVCLWPFSGQASIPYKKRLAKHIENVNRHFGKPVVVLYFGDYDKQGMIIPESAFRHVKKWCAVEFEALRVGLNMDQITEYDIEEDLGEGGKYQWEAVRADAAEEIIKGALDSIIGRDLLLELEKEKQEATYKVREAINNIDWEVENK